MFKLTEDKMSWCLPMMIGVTAIFLLFSCVFCAFGEVVHILTIAKEAASEPLLAQAYVAKVIMVRAEERKLSYEAVCKEKWQFSCWNKGTRQKPRTKAEIEMALKAWEMAKTITEKVNLYHDVSVTPYWTKAKNVTFIRQIGKLKFYYERR